jgi:hypothetical protein
MVLTIDDLQIKVCDGDGREGVGWLAMVLVLLPLEGMKSKVSVKRVMAVYLLVLLISFVLIVDTLDVIWFQAPYTKTGCLISE